MTEECSPSCRSARAPARRSLLIEPHAGHGREDGNGRPEARGRPAATYPFSPMRIRAGARPRSDPESGIGIFGAVSDPGRRLELTSLGLWPAATRSPAAALPSMREDRSGGAGEPSTERGAARRSAGCGPGRSAAGASDPTRAASATLFAAAPPARRIPQVRAACPGRDRRHGHGRNPESPAWRAALRPDPSRGSAGRSSGPEKIADSFVQGLEKQG